MLSRLITRVESRTRVKRRTPGISRQLYEQEKPDAPCEQPFSTSSGHAHASRHEQLPVLTIEEEAEHTIVEEAAHQGHRFHKQTNAQSGQYHGCGGLDWCVVLYVVWCGVMSCDALSCPVVPNIVLPCHVFHSRTENEMRMGRRQNGDAEDGLQLIQLSCGRTEHSSLSCPHQNLAQDV